MRKIIINNNNSAGRPAGSDKEYIVMRNAYILKAYNQGFRKKVIAEMYGLSYQMVSKVIKDNK